MFKKIFIVFLFALFLLPKVAFADSEYKIQLFGDANKNGIFDPNTLSNIKEEKIGDPKTVCYDGLVPCGKRLCKGTIPTSGDNEGKCRDKNGACTTGANTETTEPVYCQLCHTFIMVDKTVDYVVIKLVPLLAVLMLVIGGVMFYFGGVRPELLSRAKTLIKGVVIGLVLIYSAYMIVNIFLTVLGASKINSIQSVFKEGVFSVSCPVFVPSDKF